MYLFHNRTAKRLLTDIVEKGRPSPAFHHNDGPGMSVQEIMIPASKAGLVIGKGGETIKQLQVRWTNVFSLSFSFTFYHEVIF